MPSVLGATFVLIIFVRGCANTLHYTVVVPDSVAHHAWRLDLEAELGTMLPSRQRLDVIVMRIESGGIGT